MLLNLNINNFALIKEARIDFKEKLNILSGETGSGKSIIFEALGVCLGERANKSMIKTGANEATIEAVFSITAELEEKLKKLGLEGDSDKVIIRRDLFTEYPSVSRINGFSVTLNVLKSISKELCDIFGQYEHQMLLDPQNYINIIDSYLDEDGKEKVNKIKELYKDIQIAKAKHQFLTDKLSKPSSDKDYLEFQIKEIDSAELMDNEDEELFQELKALESFKDISDKLNQSIILYDGSFEIEESQIIEKISNVMGLLSSLRNHGKDYEELAKRVEESYYEAKDILSTLEDKLNSLTFDEERRIYLNERLSLIQNLKRKYGNTIPEIYDKLKELKDEYELLLNIENEIKKAEENIKIAEDRYNKLAKKITDIRIKIAGSIEKKVKEELKYLEMDDTQIKIEITECNPTEYGRDNIEFLVSTNKGASLKPIRDVISGGEMSRFMLAFKNLLAEENPNKTFIFDEIDAGLSGKAANAVGNRLKDLSMDRQVILISHLPQIISKATHHYKIHKESDENETISKVNYLNKDERVNELARLLSGDKITELTLENAKELLKENEV